MLLVDALVDVDAFHFKAVIDAALHLFHPQLSTLDVLELHEDGADLSPEFLFAVADDLDASQLANVLHFGLKVVLQLFVVLDGHSALTIVNI